MNWISATGRAPVSPSPMACSGDHASPGERRVLRTPDPCRTASCNPAVARKTPPLVPVSSLAAVGSCVISHATARRPGGFDHQHGHEDGKLVNSWSRCGRGRRHVVLRRTVRRRDGLPRACRWSLWPPPCCPPPACSAPRCSANPLGGFANRLSNISSVVGLGPLRYSSTAASTSRAYSAFSAPSRVSSQTFAAS